MKIYVDIDNTICKTIGTDYSGATPIKENIRKINNLFEKGNEIIYWTARGYVTRINHYELTLNQLKNGIVSFILYLLEKNQTMIY